MSIIDGYEVVSNGIEKNNRKWVKNIIKIN